MAKWEKIENKASEKGYFVIEGSKFGYKEIEVAENTPWLDIAKACKEYNERQIEFGFDTRIHFEIRTIIEETQKVYF